MTAPFAAFESATAAGAFAALANAMASINGGAAVPVIFDNGYSAALGMEGSGPMLQALDADVSAIVQGNAVAIGSTNYTVVTVEPDGTGVTVIRLQEA